MLDAYEVLELRNVKNSLRSRSRHLYFLSFLWCVVKISFRKEFFLPEILNNLYQTLWRPCESALTCARTRCLSWRWFRWLLSSTPTFRHRIARAPGNTHRWDPTAWFFTLFRHVSYSHHFMTAPTTIFFLA